MKQPPVKQHWLEVCVSIHNFHVAQLKDESNWTIEKTATVLQRSVGSVSQSLLIASWLRTHEKEIRKFRSIRDALEFIRKKKREVNTREVEL